MKILTRITKRDSKTIFQPVKVYQLGPQRRQVLFGSLDLAYRNSEISP